MSNLQQRLIRALLLLAVGMLSTILTSCGGTNENLGQPSIPQELKYEFVDEGIKLTWKVPENNFYYKATFGRDLSDPESTSSDNELISENYFQLDDFNTKLASQPFYIVYQEDGKKNYELVFPIADFLQFAYPSNSLTFSLRACNRSDGGYGDLECEYPSAPAIIRVTQPSANALPGFVSGLVTDNSKFQHNDLWTSTNNEWMTAFEGTLTFCDLLDLKWNNLPETISVKTTGSFDLKTTFVLRNYFYGFEEDNKCLRLKYKKARQGALNYTITLTNKTGSTSLTGTYEIMNSWVPTKNRYTPEVPFVPEKWNNITPKNEGVAKTVWCIENGYRDYVAKTNKCTY